MKKTLLIFSFVLLAAVSATAQEAKIGYFSFKEVLMSMPAYGTAQENLDKLQKQYADELKSAENEFNEKYELFLDQQATLADAIRQKRQADLQSLLDRNVQFKKEAERLLSQAEKDAMTPLKIQITAAVKELGTSGGYLMIVNTDSEACPYIDPARSEDITAALIQKTK